MAITVTAEAIMVVITVAVITVVAITAVVVAVITDHPAQPLIC